MRARAMLEVRDIRDQEGGESSAEGMFEVHEVRDIRDQEVRGMINTDELLTEVM